MTSNHHSPIHWPQSSNRSPQRSLSYCLWLASSVVVLLLSWVMSTGDGRQVVLPGVGVIPETCTLHTRFGVDCPGCGLTRSFIHLAHGNLRAAWSLNPVSLLLFIFVASQIPLVLNLMWPRTTIGRIIEANIVRTNIVQRETIQAGYDNCLDTPSPHTSPPNVDRVRPTYLGRWVDWNQWMLAGLMLALVLQWIVKLTMGGSWG